MVVPYLEEVILLILPVRLNSLLSSNFYVKMVLNCVVLRGLYFIVKK